MRRGSETASELMKTARRVEQKRVAKVKKQQLEPNPYHKAQYVSAYLEAKSAVISQHKAVERRHAETTFGPTPSASKELALLSKELRCSYGKNPHKGFVSTKQKDNSSLTHPPRTKKKLQHVSFGDWKEPVPSIQRELHALDVRLHTIARGGLTPPSLSTEALKRCAAPFSRALRPLFDAIKNLDTNPTAVDVQNLATESVTLLKELHAKGQLKPLEWSNVVSLCMQQLFSRTTAWQHGYFFLQTYLQKCREVLNHKDFHRDACQQTAVFAECTRFYNYGTTGPTLAQLTELCQLTQGDTKRPLAALTAAPLLSIVYDASGTDKPEGVHAFAKSYLLQRKGRLVYLHSSAWGEYAKAIHRFGASPSAIQGLIDKCTDESTTVNAKQHLSSTHVWNAYLACSEAAHALEVYQNNRVHYKLKGTSETTAALMSSLARAHTNSRSKEALELFKVLQQRGDMLHYTAGTLVALLDNYCVLKDFTSCLELALNFEAFFAPFGCREEAFGTAYHSVMGTVEEDQKPELVRSLVEAVYDSHRDIIPKIVFDKWTATYEDLTRAGKGPPAQSPSAFSELTPDALMDLL